MRWSEYYQKMDDWAVSTAVSRFSSVEDMGTSNEVVDVLYTIAFKDKKVATRIIKKALQHGVKFSGENLLEMASLCTEESFHEALHQSADAFIEKDLEDLQYAVDESVIIDIAKQYKLSAPEPFDGKYAEELYPNADKCISWEKFYDAYRCWKPEYARKRLQKLTDFGKDDKVLEVGQELFWEDESGASQFLKRALKAGVTFTEDTLSDFFELCGEDNAKQIAKQERLNLPKNLCEEEEDFSFACQSAMDAADYALDCLIQAQQALYDSGNVSFIDMVAKKKFTSIWKYASLTDADIEVERASDALADLSLELRILRENERVKMRYGSLASEIDMWIDNSILDALTHLRISKAQKQINRAITQVENIRRRLQSMC